MPTEHHRQLRRVGADSAARIAAADSSCVSSEEHVNESRKKIAKSLELLRTKFEDPAGRH